MAAAAFGVQGLPGVGVWAWGHVTHTYCIFCGSVPRHKASGKQKGCLQREGRGEATLAFQVPGRDPAGDQRPETEQSACSSRAVQPPSPPAPCNFGCGSLGTDRTGPLEGRVTHRTEAASTAPHSGIDTEGTPGSWALLSLARGQPAPPHRQDSHTGRARLRPSQGSQRLSTWPGLD